MSAILQLRQVLDAVRLPPGIFFYKNDDYPEIAFDAKTGDHLSWLYTLRDTPHAWPEAYYYVIRWRSDLVKLDNAFRLQAIEEHVQEHARKFLEKLAKGEIQPTDDLKELPT